MATSLTIQAASAKVQWDFVDVRSWGNSTNSASYSYSARLTAGTAANMADVLYVATGTLAASGTLNLDLAASLTDMFGNSVTMARVKVMYFENSNATTSTGMYVGGASSAGLINWISSAGVFATDQPKVTVRNGGAFFLCAPDATGYAVTATTADILKIANADGTNTLTYKVVLVGASA